MDLLKHPRNKHIQFLEDVHEYYFYPSGDKRKKNEAIQFDGITGWIKEFSRPFDAKKQAKLSAKNPRSEWYGMSQKDILKAWSDKGDVTRERGNRIHKVVETVVNTGEDTDSEIVDDFFRVMDEIGIEPVTAEFVVYNEKLQRATPIDLIGARSDIVVPLDIKTYQDGMQWTGYGNASMNYPLSDLPDSKYIHTSLQLSIERVWLEQLYEQVCQEGYILLYTDHFEAIPSLFLPDQVQQMEEWSGDDS